MLKLLAGTLGFSALVGMAGYLGEDIGTFFENTEVPDTSNLIDTNSGEYLVKDGQPVVNEHTWNDNSLIDARINVNFLQNYPRYKYQYEYRYKGNGAIGYFLNNGVLCLTTVDKNGGEFQEYITCPSRGLNHSLQRNINNVSPNVNTWKGLDTVSDWSMYSNIPLFENKVKGDMFIAGEIGIDEALNYTEPTIEQQQLQQIIEAFNELLDEMENEGIEKPYDNIQQAMQDYLQDMVTDIQQQITPDTTPEEVVDDIQDRLIDDIDTILPVPSFPPIIEPTEPNPQIPPSDGVTLGGVLSTAFPFCIPFDLIYLIKALKAVSEPPRWVFPIEMPRLNIHEEIVIDFAQFETVAEVCRICFTILFIFGLIMATRKLIKG